VHTHTQTKISSLILQHQTQWCNRKYTVSHLGCSVDALIQFLLSHILLCYFTDNYVPKEHSNTGLGRPWGFQDVEAPRFQDSRHMKVVRLSALCTGRLYPPPLQEIVLVLIYVVGRVAQSVNRLATGWTVRRSKYYGGGTRWGRDFSHLSRPALGPTQAPVQWVPGLRGWCWPPTPFLCRGQERIQLYLYPPSRPV
jgi:hypothetical protein